MVAGLLSEEETARVDQVVSLLEPGDALGLFPEVQALKRQCIVNRRPYLPNVHSACHWWRVEADQTAGEWTPEGKTIALVAHDSAKADMVGFAVRHHALLSRFARRIATGTTGSLLNGRLPERLTAEDRHILQPLVDGVAGLRAPDWVHCFRSGPKGGDVQIADLILDGGCDVVLFFEDPHVSREHEADIQLLERVVRLPGVRCLCFHDPATAEAWAAWAATAGHR
jgi:methylglyoxal synthase